MKRTSTTVAAGAGISLFLLLAALLYAGPLDPPGGPVTPTGPNMIFSLSPAVVITQSGTYRIVKDIQVTGLDVGITVNADGVILDLEGHDLVYVGTTTAACITINGRGVTVRNGTVRGWQGGLRGGRQVTLENMRFLDNGSGTSFGNSVVLGTDAQLLKCLFDGNERGPILGDRSVVRGCVIRQCAEGGLTVGTHSIVDGCVASFNGGANIDAGGWSVVTNCTVHAQPFVGAASVGIDARDGTVVDGCVVELPTSANLGIGIRLRDRSGARDCRVDARGIMSELGGGIVVMSGCAVRACEIVSTTSNTQSLLVQGSRNVIDGNTLIGAHVAVNVLGSGNLLTGNRVSNATVPFQINPGNSFGDIVDVSSGGAITSTVSSANIIF